MYCISRFVEDTIEILFLYIRLDSLRKGIGVKLVKYFESWIKEHHRKIEHIILNTAVPKYNQKFYERIGFSKSGESVCEYQEGSVVAVRLMKNIK
ncbi:MAG: GNAT family N-acetyltransferase [Desulfobacterales bacterium]|nr:GNAT family N-acetyltransferase [Desulfobacterales bacterium]